MDGTLDVVRGRRIDRIAGESIGTWARGFDRAVLEVGTGDGRWLYRQARSHPRWAFVGVDANAQRMREVSFRAGRKPARGGLANLLFVHSDVVELPPAFDGIADEVFVLYPWAGLLDGVWTPRRSTLLGLARLAKAGARLEVRVNLSAVAAPGAAVRADHLIGPYAAAGIRLRAIRVRADPVRTSWAMKVAHGRDRRVIVLEGAV